MNVSRLAVLPPTPAPTCPPGQFVTPGRTCSHCPPGKFSALASPAPCSPCAQNMYQPMWGTSHCLPCDHPDMVTDGPGARAASQCHFLPCPAGRFRSVGWGLWSVCLACSHGTVVAPGGRGCARLHARHHGPRRRRRHRVPTQRQQQRDLHKRRHCPRGWGKHNVTGAATSCHPCPAGTMQVEHAIHTRRTRLGLQLSSTCEQCPSGQHQPAVARTRCKSCAPGRYQELEGQHGCNPCPACDRGSRRYGCWGANVGVCAPLRHHEHAHHRLTYNPTPVPLARTDALPAAAGSTHHAAAKHVSASGTTIAVALCALLFCVLALARQLCCTTRATAAGYTELAAPPKPQPKEEQQQQQQQRVAQKDANGNWVTVTTVHDSAR